MPAKRSTYSKDTDRGDMPQSLAEDSAMSSWRAAAEKSSGRRSFIAWTVPSAERIPEGRPNVRSVAVGVTVLTPSPGGDTRLLPPCHHCSRRPTTSAGSSRTSHSQTRTTRQPSCSASIDDLSSRSLFRRILSAQSSALGPAHGVLRPWRGQPCQKHPSTNTARRRPGSTKSGVHPLASCRCRRNRPPAACTAFLSSTSGVVFSLRRPARWAPALVETQPSAMNQRYERESRHRGGGVGHPVCEVAS